MVPTTFALIGLIGFAVIWLMSRSDNPLTTASPVTRRPNSPIDEAERLLARRYAKGQINAEEYGRMLVILRH